MACPLEAAARKTQDDRDLSGHLLRSGNAEAASGACWHVGLVAHQVFIGIGPNIPKMKVMKGHYGVYSAARPCYLLR